VGHLAGKHFVAHCSIRHVDNAAGGDSGVEGKRHSRCGIAARRDHFGLRDSTAAAGEDRCWRGRIGQGKAGDAQRDFVRDNVCQPCHQTIAETYLRTNHHLTSQLPSKESIAGRFTAGENVLKTRDPDLQFRMKAKASGFYETAVLWQPPNQKKRSERIDFVTGSREKGQTYLYWRGNQLFQLPVSYWTELREWVNSPGFIDGTADFGRPIVPRWDESMRKGSDRRLRVIKRRRVLSR